jgi:Phasin protein
MSKNKSRRYPAASPNEPSIQAASAAAEAVSVAPPEPVSAIPMAEEPSPAMATHTPQPAPQPVMSIADFQARAISIGLAHVEQGLAWSARLIAAHKVEDVLSLQEEFAQSQAEKLAAEAAELNSLVLRMGLEAADAMQSAVLSSLRGWARNTAA